MQHTHVPVGYKIRRAVRADAEQIAALFELVYAASSHPCKDPAFVAETLKHRRTDLWYVSEHGDHITGCMGMLLHEWNRSWEIVRGVTHPADRGSGLATALAQRAVDEVWALGDGDLIAGYPRNRTMYRILSEAVQPPMVAVGHDGAINIAGGTREYHLAGVAFGRRKHFEHLTPPSDAIASSSFVLQRVFVPLGLSPRPGIYPPLLIAGDDPHHPDYGPFTFHYSPFCPSDAVEITGYTGPKQNPDDIAADLLTTLDSFGYACHARLAVLVDKREFQNVLLTAGFGITAYLPAWHLQNGIRYDCVLMTRRTTVEEPVDHGTRDIIELFNRGFSECLHSPTA
jgi:GNAT superfamily N-acetyltransferase